MTVKKVAREVAEKEIEKWLDFKRVRESKRESAEDQIEVMVQAIMDGFMTLNEETGVLSIQLVFSTGTDEKIKVLEIQPRANVGKLKRAIKGIKTADADGRVQAYIACITEQPMGVVLQLDTEDYALFQAIALFFF